MRCSVLALSAALAACGSTHDLSLPSAPFATIRGHVDPATVAARANGQPILAALVWGALPNVPLLCFQAKGDAVVDANCPDPYGFFPGGVEAVVPVAPDGDGNFEFQLNNLPPANVLVGDDTNHVAYASIVLVADVNGDGTVSWPSSANIRLPRPDETGGGGQGGGGGGGGGRPGGNGGGQQRPAPDEVIGASFWSIVEPNERLSFREGDFEPLKLFYPQGCVPPPAGFSTLSDNGWKTVPETCDAQGLDHRIEVKPLDETAGRALACRRGGRGFGPIGQPPEQDPTPLLSSVDLHCVNHELLVLTPKDSTTSTTPAPFSCSTFAAVALKGCTADLKCETPEWDLTANPPKWWPCAP